MSYAMNETDARPDVTPRKLQAMVATLDKLVSMANVQNGYLSDMLGRLLGGPEERKGGPAAPLGGEGVLGEMEARITRLSSILDENARLMKQFGSLM